MMNNVSLAKLYGYRLHGQKKLLKAFARIEEMSSEAKKKRKIVVDIVHILGG